MVKVYVVDLTPEEREELMGLLRGGQARVRRTNRARILLLANEGRTDEEVAEALLTSVSTVERTRKRFVEGGLERALNESPRPGGKRKLTGKQEAYVVALACSDPPEGKKRWSMQMLADKLVEVEIELSVLSRQCLERRIPDAERLTREVGAWQQERNEGGATVQWRFTASDAREKLAPLYPAQP
jgi:transposase